VYKFKSEALDKEISVGGNKSILEVFNQEGHAVNVRLRSRGRLTLYPMKKVNC